MMCFAWHWSTDKQIVLVLKREAAMVLPILHLSRREAIELYLCWLGSIKRLEKSSVYLDFDVSLFHQQSNKSITLLFFDFVSPTQKWRNEGGNQIAFLLFLITNNNSSQSIAWNTQKVSREQFERVKETEAASTLMVLLRQSSWLRDFTLFSLFMHGFSSLFLWIKQRIRVYNISNCWSRGKDWKEHTLNTIIMMVILEMMMKEKRGTSKVYQRKGCNVFLLILCMKNWKIGEKSFLWEFVKGFVVFGVQTGLSLSLSQAFF